MKGKQLLILAVVAAVLIIAATKSGQRELDTSLDWVGKRVLAEMDMNAVDVITITGAAASASIRRTDTGWVVNEKFGYAADFDKIRDTVIDLVEAKVADVIDLEPAEHSRLGIAAPSLALNAKRVTLAQGETALASLILGNDHMKASASAAAPGAGYPDGRYVSVEGSDRVFLVNETFSSVSENAIDWVDTELCNIAAGDIIEISIAGTDRVPVKLMQDGTDLTLAGLADNKELDVSKLSSLRNALSYLNLSDIADPTLSDEATGLDAPTTFSAITKNGTTYTLNIGGADESSSRYIRVEVAYTEPTVEAEGEETDEAKAEARKTEIAKTKADATALHAKLSPWTYLIASYKGDTMLTTRNSLVKEKADENPADNTAAIETATPVATSIATAPVVEPVTIPNQTETNEAAAKSTSE
jgi:hypothetical protein